jgi:hypothetical protein
MRLRVLRNPDGSVYDVVGAKQCTLCNAWYDPQVLRGSYCRFCRNHYQRWRYEVARHNRDFPNRMQPVDIQTFREKYQTGILSPLVPWNWTGETGGHPLGAVILDEARFSLGDDGTY